MVGFAVVQPAIITATSPVYPRSVNVTSPGSSNVSGVFRIMAAAAPNTPAMIQAQKWPIYMPTAEAYPYL